MHTPFAGVGAHTSSVPLESGFTSSLLFTGKNPLPCCDGTTLVGFSEGEAMTDLETLLIDECVALWRMLKAVHTDLQAHKTTSRLC